MKTLAYGEGQAVEKLRLASLLLEALAYIPQYAARRASSLTAIHGLRQIRTSCSSPVRLAMLVFEQPGVSRQSDPRLGRGFFVFLREG